MYATVAESPALAAARSLAAEAGRDESGAVGLPVLEHQVCAEAGLWAPGAARRALAQSQGDVARAVALVRVWAAALPQRSSPPIAPGDVVITRRLSAAFAEVPGGQWLGAAPELASRLLDWGDGATGDGPRGERGAVAAGKPPTGAARVDGNGHEPDATLPPTRADCPRVRYLVTDVPVLARPRTATATTRPPRSSPDHSPGRRTWPCWPGARPVAWCRWRRWCWAAGARRCSPS